VNIPAKGEVPNTSFTYTYEVLDKMQNVEKDISVNIDMNRGIKIKPLHTLQSLESENNYAQKVVLNNNYTYETTEEESNKVKAVNIEETNFTDSNNVFNSSTKENVDGDKVPRDSPPQGNVEDDEIFTSSLIVFPQKKPKKVPYVPPDQKVCEVASRILFQSISWALQIPVFRAMAYPTQVAFMRSSWVNLFILGLAQCKEHINLDKLLEMITNNLQNSLNENITSLSRLRQLTNTLAKIKAVNNSLEKMKVDATEFCLLRLSSIFLPDQPSQELREETENIYKRIISALETNSKERFGTCIQLLSAIRNFQPNILEELFFSSLIGNVPIDNVIPFIISMQLNRQQCNQ